MSELKTDDKVVTVDVLEEFYNEKILPYLGGNVPALTNKFKRSDIYSTDEKIVGCWIDGKPLYQKVLSYVGTISKTRVAIGTVDNVDTMVHLGGHSSRTQDGVTWYCPIPESVSSAQMISVYFNKNTSQVFIANLPGTYSDTTWYITCQYTKSTDSANSFNVGNENDYSTEECIIGTWIDGKPLYQKTIISNQQINNGETVTLFEGELTDVDYLQKAKDVMFVTNADAYSSEYVSSNTDKTEAILYKRADNSGLLWVEARNRTIYKTILTVQYTKTA